MSHAPPPYRALAASLLRPSLGAALVAAVAAVGYAAIRLSLPPALLPRVVGGTALVAVFALGIGHIALGQLLSTLRALAFGEVSDNRRNCLRALAEVRRFPDRAAMVHLLHWAGGTVTVVWWAWLSFPEYPALMWDFLGVGLPFTLSSALLGYLWVLPRSRTAAQALLMHGGFRPQQVFDALNVHRRQLRRRLILFTAMTVLTPSLLMAGQVLGDGNRALDALLTVQSPSEAAWVLERHRTRQQTSTLLWGAWTLVMSVGLSLLAGKALTEPLQRLAHEAERVAKGDLREVKVVLAEDELWEAAAAFGTIQLHLASALCQMREAGQGITGVSAEMVALSGRHEASAAEQAASLIATVATTEELARSARQIAANAAPVAALAHGTLNAAQEGRSSADTFVHAMQRTKAENQAIADAVVRLNKRVQQVGKIVEFINGVADKSDLLALNAELEGTKAGEVGRGFSLVAAEMRRLAETVVAATQEIAQLIDDVRDATHAAVMATEAGVKATEHGTLLATNVAKRLDNIVQLADQTSDSIRAISLSTQQQQTGTDQLAEAMNAVLEGTSLEARASREAAAATTDLFALAHELKLAVDRFQLAQETRP